MAQLTDPMRISSDEQRRTAPPPGLQSSDSSDGLEHSSMLGKAKNKAKNKAKQLRERVKENYKAQYDHPSDDKEEEEETAEDEDQGHEKPDENVKDVTKGMAGLGGLGTANKDDRANQETGKVNENRLGDILGKKDDGMAAEETRKESEGPDDEFRHKDGMLTEAKEKPEEGLSSFKETGQDRGSRDDGFLTTETEETGTDVGTPSIVQRAAQAMLGATGGIIGLGKGNKQEEEGGEEKSNSSEFDKPTVGLKEVPKALEEEFQSLLEKSKEPRSDVGEGNELSSNEKPTEEVTSDAPVVTKKASGLIQGLRDSLTTDQGKKDDIVPEEQNRENQDEEMQSAGEEKGGQSYAEKLFAVKSVISSKLGYGGLPTEEKTDVQESKGEDELQDPKTEETPTEEVDSGASVDTKNASGLIQGLRDSLTSDRGKKDDIVPEEQSRENQDEGMQSVVEEKGGQSYAEKLFSAKNVISSKLGYGGPPTEETADVEESKGEDELQGAKTEEVESGVSVDTKQHSGLIQGLKNSLISNRGDKDDIVVPKEPSRENRDEGKQSEGEEKQGQKSGIASMLGYGGLPSEEKAAVEEPKGEEKAAFEESKGEDKLPDPKAEEGTENKETFKSTLVSKLSPGEDDKALSEKITEAFNSSAKSILGGFYGGSPKEAGPPSPSPAKDATAELPQNNNPQNSSSPKGIMGRVTGVVSSFIGKKPKEHAADNPPHTQEPTFGEHQGSSETQTGNQIEGGKK